MNFRMFIKESIVVLLIIAITIALSACVINIFDFTESAENTVCIIFSIIGATLCMLYEKHNDIKNQKSEK